ncbi:MULTISPECIES: hypothetical protein [Sorangium]|uniref:Alpha/beta hydrolase n=1 Tax=Sorangium cellulosum TaxID=56 RepID=A0A4P2QEG6_SORCE|nr:MULTISPECIES: hypothetical protein [Sorangium]AUX28139.1 uncharacterized protein SOCE836_002070 [Sorangium cellulosum]WCQ87543.1 hypothetical protein NQZ70_00206 [Sorangium sp. Soce836]
MTRFAPLSPPRAPREARAIETWARRFRGLGVSPATAHKLARHRVALAVGGVAFATGVIGAVIATRRGQDAPRAAEPFGRTSSVRVRPRPVAVAWLGPVSAAQVSSAELAGVPVVHRTCTGDGSPSCSQIADSWLDGDGRRLPGCRRALGLPAGPLVLAAFSAGGHIVKRLLADPRDRAEVAAVVLADATYTTEWTDRAQALAAPIGSLVDYAAEAAGGGRLFVASASSAPNKQHPTGAQTLAAVARELGSRVHAEEGTLAGLPAPERCWEGGGVHLLDYGARYSHAAHATELAPKVWAALVRPWFEGVS